MRVSSSPALLPATKKKLLIYEMKISDPDFLKLLQQEDFRRRRSPRSVPCLRQGRRHPCAPPSLAAAPSRHSARRQCRLCWQPKPAQAGTRSTTRNRDSSSATRRSSNRWKQSLRKTGSALSRSSRTRSSLQCSIVPAKKVAKEVARQIAIKPVLEQVLDKVIDTKDSTPFEPEEVAQTVREAFHDEVQGAVQEALEDVVVSAASTRPPKPPRKSK